MWEKIEYNKKFLDEMLEMTAENYGKDEHIANKDFICHEYFRNPSGDPIISLGYDRENNLLAGQYVVIAQRMYVANQQINAILSLNTLTRKTYRGQGVFVNLAEDVYRKGAEKGIYFCYGAPNQNSHHGFIAKLEFIDIGILPLYLKIINPFNLVLEKVGIHIKSKGKIDIKSNENIIDITLSNVSAMQKFWDNVKGKYPVMVVRDADFFRWRYLDVPIRNYNIFAFMEKGNIKGYIVTRITEVSNMKCGMIVDFLYEKGKVDVGICLLRYATQRLKTESVSLMGCLMQQHFEEAFCLRKIGFFRCPKKLEPQPFPIIFRKFKDVPRELDDFQNWFFTMGDYDVI